MRFFSNDARESSDDQSDEERTDRVQSEPVAVPNQRAGSPWSNTPPAADADAPAGRPDTDPPPFHEPGPQPTAFGASTVGGAVAASATANPINDRRDATDRITAADSGVGDDASVAPGDGVVSSSTTTYAGDAADRDAETKHSPDRTDPDDIVDVPLDDHDSPGTGTTGPGAVSARSGDLDTDTDRDAHRTARDENQSDRELNRDESVTTYDDPDATRATALKDDGGFDDPKAVDPATDQPLDSKVDGPGTDTDAGVLSDDGGFDDPKVVDPAADSSEHVPPAVVAAPVAVAAAATPAAATSATTSEHLFDQEDARGFQERWRDVQLRFVDSPKDAAGDAAQLVDEAVEKLTASLRAQRTGLHQDTEDTEQLRVQLRGYRDILNRILSL
jgi:hypothetical protein